MMTGCTQCFQICSALSKTTSSCCFPAQAAEHGAGVLCEMQIMEGNAACRALVPCAVTVSPWTSETASGSVMHIAHPMLLVPLLKNCQVLVPQKILEITSVFMEFLFLSFFSATLNDSNLFQPLFIQLVGLVHPSRFGDWLSKEAPTDERSWQFFAPQISALSFRRTRCGAGKSPLGAAVHSAPSPPTLKGSGLSKGFLTLEMKL